MRTVFDIFVYTPDGKKCVASTWRSDYASFLLDDMVRKHSHVTQGWQGFAQWREIETTRRTDK